MYWLIVTTLLCFAVFAYLTNRAKILKQNLNKKWGLPKPESSFNFYLIRKYFDNKIENGKFYHIISENTFEDLDLAEVFKLIDRTTSKIGQQYLYFKLRTLTNIDKLLIFNSLSNIFLGNNKLTLYFRSELSKLNSENTYYLESLIHQKHLSKPKNIWIIYTFSILAFLVIFLSFFNVIISILLLPIFIINTFFHYKNKGVVKYYLVAINELAKSITVAQNLSKNIQIKEYFISYSFLNKLSLIQKKANFIRFEGLSENDFTTIIWAIIEVIKIQFNLESIIFYSFVDSISSERKSIDELFEFIGEIDSAISVSTFKDSCSSTICNPVFVNNKRIRAIQIHHPLITVCTANDINLLDASVLLTGSNMSGKTTFIRTIAINSILAQTIFTCFAKEYEAPFLRVFSSIKISDNLMEGSSYYLAEVKTLKEFIVESEKNEPCLFILDELLKGTNTIERISAGKAILSYLNKKDHLVFVSTHDIELTNILKDGNYELYHFSEQIIENNLIFDHKIKQGVSPNGNAIKILEIYEYPDEIINDAKITELKIQNT